jgi:hypothetical protein
VNVYRLIKAGLASDEVDGFLADRRYEPVVLLLGILIGFPRQARHLFESVAEANPLALVRDFLPSVPPRADDEAWGNLVAGAAEVLDVLERSENGAPMTVDRLREWVQVVHRYSFDGALVAAGALPPDGVPPPPIGGPA